MKTKLLFILIALMLLCSGCDLFQQRPKTTLPEMNTGKDISQTQSIIEKSTKEIKEATGDISKETQAIKKEIDQIKIPAELRKEIDVHLDKINKSSNTISEKTQDINKSVAELAGATSLLDNAGKKIITIEKALDDITKERDRAIIARDEALADRDSALHKTLQWLIVGCIVGCGAFIVLFFYTGSKGGLFAAGGCGLVLIIAIFVNMYIVWLAIAGGVLLLLMVGWLLYNIYIKNKAFSEVVSTVEVTKTGLTLDKKAELFGKDGEIGLMNKIQSTSTIDLIKKEKAKMSLWNSVKNKINKKDS